MKSRFKPNNFFALLIAVILIIIGFVLAAIHRQSEANKGEPGTPVSAISETILEIREFSS